MPDPVIFVQPLGEFVWSELPISAQCYFFFVTDPTEKLIVDLKVGGVLLTSLSYPASDTEPVFIDLQNIAKSICTPERPVLKDIYGTFLNSPTMQWGVTQLDCYFRLSSQPLPGTLVSRKVLKGGWENMNFVNRGDPNFYITFSATKFYPNGSRILSHVPSGRLMDAQEHGWLSYVQEMNVIPYQKVTYIVKYNDGTSTFINRYWPAISLNKTTSHIPLGIDQVGLDPSNKGVQYADIYVNGGSDGEIILAQYKVTYDYRPLYNWLDVHYRNSLGGWDFIKFRGAIEFDSSEERKEYELQNNNAKGSNNYYDSSIRLSWKANTGYISKQHMIALNDLLHSKDVCIFFEEKWLPIKCTTKNFKWNDTKNSLWNEVFEFESAGVFKTLPIQLMQFFAKQPEFR